MEKKKRFNKVFSNYLVIILKLVSYINIGMYGTKEELEDSEDFFPFVYVPINIHWIIINLIFKY